MRSIAKLLFLCVGGLLIGSAGCAAEPKKSDCWFTYSNPVDYTEVLRTPTDPLLDLWSLPYSPCTFDKKSTAFQSRD